MKAKVWFLPTLLNLALLAGMVWHLTPAPTAPSNPTAQGSPEPSVAAASPQVIETGAQARRHACPPPFNWSQLESTDYPAYVNNLRAIGCPEVTIQDIITADVHALFESARKRVLEAQPDNYWQSNYREAGPQPAELTQLAQEERAVLRSLINGLGPEPTVPPAGWSIEARATLPSVLQAKRDLIKDWRQRHEGARDSILAAANDRDLAEDDWQRLAGIARQEREEFERLLTASEREEYDLRYSPSADLLREELAGVEVTEAEFRRLFKLRQEYDRRLGALEATGESDLFAEWEGFRKGVGQILDSERFAIFAARSLAENSSN